MRMIIQKCKKSLLKLYSVFSPLDDYFQEEEEDSSLDDNFNLNQDEDEEMEYEHSIQSDDNSDEFV